MNRSRLYTFCSLVILILISAGCSDHITVRTDYDRDIDIRQFPSFVLIDKEAIEDKNNPLYQNELNDKRIRSAVVDQLVGKGYVQDEASPALKVHYHIVIEDKTQIREDPYTPYWIDRQRDLYKYREGTLIIDLMDASKEALLWRGWATRVLNDSEAMSEEMIQSAVAKIFSSLPAAGNPK